MKIEYYTEKGLSERIKEIREMVYMLKERELELINLHNRLSYEDTSRTVIDGRARIHTLGSPIRQDPEPISSAYNDTQDRRGYLHWFRKKDLSTERELT